MQRCEDRLNCGRVVRKDGQVFGCPALSRFFGPPGPHTENPCTPNSWRPNRIGKVNASDTGRDKGGGGSGRKPSRENGVSIMQALKRSIAADAELLRCLVQRSRGIWGSNLKRAEQGAPDLAGRPIFQ